MIEKGLVGELFLVSNQKPSSEEGYMSREDYSRQLADSGVIGRYDVAGGFHMDEVLTKRLQLIIPHIADALVKDSRNPKYKLYKFAAVEKGSLNVIPEWDVVQHVRTPRMGLQFARLLLSNLHVTSLLIDMGGPAYEMVVPGTVSSLLKKLSIVNQQAQVA